MSSRALCPLPSGIARATTEHMPFEGHRTVAQIWAASEAARNKETADSRQTAKMRYAVLQTQEYGFDPECLKGAKG